MKKFIATISYFGVCVNGSSIRLVEASKKAIAQKRAENTRQKNLVALKIAL